MLLLLVLFSVIIAGYSSAAVQPSPITLAIYSWRAFTPGTAKSAVEIQSRLERYDLRVHLICLKWQKQFVMEGDSQCKETIDLKKMREQILTGKVDLFISGIFLETDMEPIRKILQKNVTHREETGVVGAGNIYKIHIATLTDTGIRKLDDLNDKKNSTGPEHSIHDLHAHDVFKAEKLDKALKNRLHHKLDQQPNLLLHREIDDFFETARVPSTHVAKVAEDDDLVLIAIPKETVEKMNNLQGRENHPYIKTRIELSEYENEREEKVPSAGVAELISATSQCPVEIIKQVTEILIELSLTSPDDLASILSWAKRQRFLFHPVAAPIIKEFLDYQITYK